jgi:hypothetical protein
MRLTKITLHVTSNAAIVGSVVTSIFLSPNAINLVGSPPCLLISSKTIDLGKNKNKRDSPNQGSNLGPYPGKKIHILLLKARCEGYVITTTLSGLFDQSAAKFRSVQ